MPSRRHGEVTDEVPGGRFVVRDVHALYGGVITKGHELPAVQELSRLYAQSGPLDSTAVQVVLDILDRVRARPYAEEMAGAYFQQAQDSLQGVSRDSVAQSRLSALASSLLGRES